MSCPYRFISEKPYLIAEIGGNHEGSFEKAKEQCLLAIASGADCVKYQLYTAEGLVNPELSPVRHTHFKKFELSQQEHIELAEMCKSAGRDYLASVWELEMLEWIDPYLKHYKIGSGDLTAVPLLRAFATRGKPIMLSTGLATLAEVQFAVDVVREANHVYCEEGMLALLQCTAMYPIPDSDANLSVIKTLSEIPNVCVGYSDHTMGLDALVTSVAVGARILEFHFTDEREGREFRDHKVSLMVDEVKELRRRIDKTMEYLGHPEKHPLDIERSSGHVASFRRGIYPSEDLDEGRVIQPADLVCLRPNEGIGAAEYDKVVGRRLRVPVKKLQKLNWDLFDS